MEDIKLFEEWEQTRDVLVFFKHLVISSQGIESLNGIQKIENCIEFLDCSKNSISSLKELENCVEMTGLFCNNNKLESLKGVEKLNKITNLNLSYNNFSNLKGIENLTNIEYLNLFNNNLTSLKDIEKLLKLKDLDVGLNFNLESFEFGNFSIDAFELEIDKTDLSKFKKLKRLGFRGKVHTKRYFDYIIKYCRENDIYIDGLNSYF